MKKILSLILILLLAAAVGIAFRWRQAADRLSLAARGGVYRSLGLRLEVAPARDGVKGLARLKPYVEIPQVVLDLGAWRGPGSVPLGSARLSTSLWHPEELLLVLEPGELRREGLEARRLAFELSLPDLLLGLRAEELAFRNSASGERLSVEKPWLQIGPPGAELPARIHFRIEGLNFSKELAGNARQEIQLGPIETGFLSEAKGGDRSWKIFHRGQGGGFRFPHGQAQVSPWSFEAEGSIANLPWDRWKRLGGEWRQFAESRPSAESSPSQIFDPRYEALLSNTLAFLVELRPQPERVEFRWAGLHAEDEAKQNLVTVEPLEFQVHYLDSPDGMKTDGKGELRRLELKLPGQRFELTGLEFSQKSAYRGLRYRDWLGYFGRYYAATLALPREPQFALRRLQDLYLSYLAQMPDEMSGEFRVQGLKYQGPRYQTEHRAAALTFAVRGANWDYRLQDDFDSVLVGEPEKSIQQGRIDLDFGFQLPWSELLAFVRKAAVATESAPSWQTIFSGRPVGLDWKWRLDFGANLFAIGLDLKMEAEAAKLAGKTPLSWRAEDMKLALPKMAEDTLGAFLSQGKMDFQVRIDRLSKLQAALDKAYSGASLGLAVLGPYVVVDAKSDSLQAKLNLQNGEVLLNGRRNSEIEEFLRKSFP
ncbi:MAG: hypothetical protein U1F66_06150 [bacterium]